MVRPHTTILYLCTTSALGGSTSQSDNKKMQKSELPTEMSLPAKSSLMRSEDLGARTVALNSAGHPEPLHRVVPAHSMIEEHSFVVDANGQRVIQNKKKKMISMKSQVEVEDDCAHNPDDPLCAGQNKSNVVDVQREIDLTEQMINGVALYCCCGDAKVSQRWQEHLVKKTVPGYCKKSWYNQYCTDSDSEYSPSKAMSNEGLERWEQIEMCNVCHECFQKKCSFWAEDQQPIKKLWVNTITCKEATTQFKEPEPEITNLEVKRELEEADACASGSLTCPSNIHLAIEQYPVIVLGLVLVFVAQCVAGAFYVKYRCEAWEDAKNGEEHAPILDPSLISDIKD
eukprot:gnl/MRDRNA2_/MRDRNA2_35064_c0_seq1.p1 gnl/MRDRNA2_/MRDRNA2_35064_c0~~gnl/MRDRNA2_/MRDRNA2_35064_c0_seq1.p1  ORF type:complete len:342 (+),score=59.39 gnl/MRDRNA2_/MRDRNA2_35064_c0_seq1:95-1120(+)